MFQITPKVKNEIYGDLADLMIAGLKNNTINTINAKDSANFMLEHLDKVKDDNELLIFLEELGKKWQIYQSEFLKFKTNKINENDLKRLADIQGKLKQLSDQ